MYHSLGGGYGLRYMHNRLIVLAVSQFWCQHKAVNKMIRVKLSLMQCIQPPEEKMTCGNGEKSDIESCEQK